MLNRQKTLLLLLDLANRPVSKIELTKWSFLLRNEMPSCGGSTFYEFLPYKQGPFSFCLYREIDALIRDGYVEVVGDFHWKSTALAKEKTISLVNTIQSDSSQLVKKFGKMNANDVVDYVYDRHPVYTMNSERRKLAKRPIAEPMVFTAGYERLSVDAFLNRLLNNGIQRIIDVRNNPIARRYGFHKSTLNRLSSRVQIDYIHIPELGIQSSLRRSLESLADYEELFKQYEETTLDQEKIAIEKAANLITEKASVLICMEADPVYCHRTRLANQISIKTGLDVKDLGGCCS